MASIPKASTLLLKISLFLITAINIAVADRRSILAELYKQAADQNRPLILVVDNHSKDDGHGHQNHQSHGVYKGSKHESAEATPVHYIYPSGSPSKSVSGQEKKAKKDSKADLLKFYLSRLLSQSQGNRDGLKKKAGRSDDRYDVYNYDNRNNYYKDDRDQRDRRDQYKVRDQDEKYKRNHYRPYYYKPRESREYKIRNKYYNYKPEERYRYDQDRYDRDRQGRYRSEIDREDRDRVERYRSDRDRVDRYYQDRNKGRDYGKINDYRNDRDRYQYPTQQRYQYQDRNKGRDYDKIKADQYTDNYGADVVKNLLRFSNNLNCEAKYACKGSCYERARVLRQSAGNCEDVCDEKYDCDESKENEVNKEDKNGGCDGRGDSSESCGDEKANGNISTRGYTDKDEEEDECANTDQC